MVVDGEEGQEQDWHDFAPTKSLLFNSLTAMSAREMRLLAVEQKRSTV